MSNNVKNKINNGVGERIGRIALYTITATLALLCLYPFLQVLISSFADEVTLTQEGYKLIPSKFSLDAWRTLFANQRILRAYALTIGTTVVGTIVCVLITAMAAYALSGKKLKYRNFFNFIYYLTMLFSGGLIPYYIVVSNYLHLTDNLLVYILPFSFNVWNMFLLRNFFNDIPEEIKDIAQKCTDGIIQNDPRVLYSYLTEKMKEYMPLSAYEICRRDTLAPLGLFVAFDRIENDTIFPNIVYHYVKYEKLGLKIKYVFHRHLIQGFWMGYYTL